MTKNLTLIQFFHWYYPSDGSLWNYFADETNRLSKLGITGVWLPPAYKGASGGLDVGYAPYDLYDLGEFDQKGSVRTKYGTRQEYMRAIKRAQRNGLQVYADVVFNHKAGGDEKEIIPARKVNPENRTEFISDKYDIESYTKFTFPGRKGKYSNYVWDWHSFTGVDRDEKAHEDAIFSIQNEYGEGWEPVNDDEMGNYDFLMLNDIETRNESVRDELKKWGEWYLKQTNVDGFRLDAIKHINPDFMADWIAHMRSIAGKPLFVVGEYWNVEQKDVLLRYIDRTKGEIQLFDTILHMHFHHASTSGHEYDMGSIFKDTLVEANPMMAVTFVDNHDTQPLQSLESPVDFWFKPLAYALILLRQNGIPCIFYSALYGSEYKDKGLDGEDHDINLAPVDELNLLLPLRLKKAYGPQRDYLDHHNVIGWTREGDKEHPHSGLAVLMSNGDEGFKSMEVGIQHAGKTFIDAFGYRKEKVVIDQRGWGTFLCNPGSVSVWVLR